MDAGLVVSLKGMWNSSEFERESLLASDQCLSLKGMWNSSEFERSRKTSDGKAHEDSLKGMWNSSEFESVCPLDPCKPNKLSKRHVELVGV